MVGDKVKGGRWVKKGKEWRPLTIIDIEEEGREKWWGCGIVDYTLTLYQPCTVRNAKTGEERKERMCTTFYYYK